jgi:hypothetical protein
VSANAEKFQLVIGERETQAAGEYFLIVWQRTAGDILNSSAALANGMMMMLVGTPEVGSLAVLLSRHCYPAGSSQCFESSIHGCKTKRLAICAQPPVELTGSYVTTCGSQGVDNFFALLGHPVS